MTAPVGDVLAGVRVLDGLWSVEVLSVDLHATSISPASLEPSVDVLDVGVLTATFDGAERIAARHGLAPAEQDVVPGSYGLPTKLRRQWSGWAATEPGQVPVSVHLTAFEPLADHASPTGPGARDGWQEVPLFGDGSDDESGDGNGGAVNSADVAVSVGAAA
ncbi:hypothetical protein [Promicromonospora soli]|uniref:Uncharacterized protein n=1 Tax=Promicromonospora soli TaxID=2035533 RepID=A0A919G9A8_9MICO|nr:hypothetical protein [Promicromonospora soli]GHH80420.1 hypothetical protein GCM10017772_48470 [Promicromonospora soli]